MTVNSIFGRKIISLLMIVILTITYCLASSMDSFAFETFTGQSPFGSTGYSKYYHNKDKFDGETISNGIDVSEWQNPAYCNYSKAKKAGVEFAIIRVGGSKYVSGGQFEDTYWKDHFKKAKAAGLKLGIYYFSQAKTTSEAKSEANYFCDLFEAGVKELYGSDNAKSYLKLPVYMDYEFAGGSAGRLYKIKSATATKCAKKFCETIKSRGYKPGIYANLNFLNDTIDGATLGESYDIWAAQYYKKCEYEGNYTKWQYSSSAKINGLTNSKGEKVNIDASYWYIKGSESESEAQDTSAESKKDTSAEPEKEKPVITPTTLKKLTGGKKQFKATWVKQAKKKVDGYQIQYSRYKDMSYDLKKKATSYKTTSKTFKTNFRKYKYYVRIRTYKKIDGELVYSKWSGKKTVYVK